MGSESLIEKLADMQAKAKAATFSDTLSDVEDEALIDTLADMYRWPRPEIIHVTLGDVQAHALFNTLADTLQKTEEETHCNKQS